MSFEFKVGDRVRYIDSENSYQLAHGGEGAVVNTFPYNNQIQVKLDDGTPISIFKASRFEKIDPHPTTQTGSITKDNLNVGDTVIHEGKKVRIIQVDRSDCDLPYRISDKKFRGKWVRASALTRDHEFKVGDRVRVIATKYTTNQTGDIGYITNIEDPYLKVNFTGPNTVKKQWLTCNTYKPEDLVHDPLITKDTFSGVQIVIASRTHDNNYVSRETVIGSAKAISRLEDLSKANPGMSFTALVEIGSVVYEAPKLSGLLAN